MSEIDLLAHERALWEAGKQYICGVDEAGRGPLAGPVCAAAVIFPKDFDLEAELPGLNDSKKLSDKRRRELYPLIQEKALCYGIGLATEQEIDEINILQATFLAMHRAVSQLSQVPEFVLVDGNRDPKLDLPTDLLIHGDGLSASIAAASVLAKVYRDDRMLELDKTYPQYGFAVHKGYGTKAHYGALEEFGPSPIHRQSFLKKFYANR